MERDAAVGEISTLIKTLSHSEERQSLEGDDADNAPENLLDFLISK